MAGEAGNKSILIAIVAIVVVAVVLVAAFQMSGGGKTTTTATGGAGATTTPLTTGSAATGTSTGAGGGEATTATATGAITTSTVSATTTTEAATTTQTPTQCREKIKLVVLTRHPSDIQEMAKRGFLKSELAKKYCVEDIMFIALPPGFWPQYIQQGGVDVAWGGGPTLFDNLYESGLLRPLEGIALEAANQIPDTIAGMPMKRYGPDGKLYWVGAAVASFGFTVNTKVAQQLGFDVNKLRHWYDLASDDLGLILLQYGVPPVAIANPLQSTSNTRMYEIILQAYGWERGWQTLTLMAANSKIMEGSELVRDAVINGEVLVGITIDFYGYTAERITHGVCRYILPEGETIVNGDPIAVAVSTKHPEAAEAFVAWVLTEGQAIWLNPNINRLPANPNVFHYDLNKLCAVSGVDCATMQAQVNLLGEKYQRTMKAYVIEFNDTLALETELPMQLYFVATLKDEQSLLQEAWLKLLKAYYIDKRITRERFEELKKLLGEPVVYTDPITGKETKFTLEDAIRVNKIIKEALQRHDTKVKDLYMNAWREAARAKYKQVIEMLGG